MKFYPKEKILIRKGYKFLYHCRVSGKGRGKTFFKDGIFVTIYSRDIVITYHNRIWIKSNGVFSKIPS